MTPKKMMRWVWCFMVLFCISCVPAHGAVNLDIEFSRTHNLSMFTRIKSPIEKALWNGDRLEVTLLYTVNCEVSDVKGRAELSGDVIELTVDAIRPTNHFALCERVERGLFVIRGIPKKNYTLVFKRGLDSSEILLNKDRPYEVETPESEFARTAGAELEKMRRGEEQQFLDYSSRIEANPDDDEAYYQRAFVGWRIGERDLAIADLTRSMELNPLHTTNVYRFRAEMYCEMGQYDKAWEDWNQIKAHYDDPEFEARLVRASGGQK